MDPAMLPSTSSGDESLDASSGQMVVSETDRSRLQIMLKCARLWQRGWKTAVRGVRATPALFIFGLAFSVRLVYNLTAAAGYRPIYDAALYDFIARNLINHQCYCSYGSHISVARAPLWPATMVAIYTVFGQNSFYARMFLCALGAATCVIVYRFARELFGVRTGLVAGALAAVYTGLFLYDGWLYTEALYTFCVTGATYALYRVQASRRVALDQGAGVILPSRQRIRSAIASYRYELVCGVLIGAATLTRPNGLALLGIVALWAVIAVRAQWCSWRAALRSTALIAVVAIMLVVPWTVRNYAVAGAFIPVETGLGEVLLGSYNDRVAVGGLGPLGSWMPPKGALNHDQVPYTPAMDRQDTARALQWMVAHPASVVSLWSLHLVYMWQPYTYSYGLPIEEYPSHLSSHVVWALIDLESIPIFLLAAAGLWLTRRKSDLVPIYLLLGTTVLVNMLLYSSMRFRAPIEPLLVLLAAVGLTRIPWRVASTTLNEYVRRWQIIPARR